MRYINDEILFQLNFDVNSWIVPYDTCTSETIIQKIRLIFDLVL